MANNHTALQMPSAKLADTLETYSNSIVAFLLVQPLIFLYTLGNSESFSRHILCMRYVPFVVILHFLACAIGGCVAVNRISRVLHPQGNSHWRTTNAIRRGKIGVIVLFISMPIIALIFYGYIEPPSQATCQAGISVGK
jgi:hypothetical protein